MPVEWDPGPPTPKQRIVAGILLALILLTSANQFFEWALFGGYDKQVTVACFLIAFIIVFRFMPRTWRV